MATPLTRSSQMLLIQPGAGLPSRTPECAGLSASVLLLPAATLRRHLHPAASAQWSSAPKPTIDSLDLPLVEREEDKFGVSMGD